MQDQLIECVPNISEGRDLNKINEIANIVTTIPNVKLLDIDSGYAANRTVITFIGNPENVVEAAFLLIKKASELIDMSKQKGEHLRSGATDVCPLIPISNVTLEETIKYAHALGNKIGNELGISGYYYEASATKPKRKNLENCRKGEYEGLNNKLKHPDWIPDFGPLEFNEQIIKSGITFISARNFLIAYNVNLKSKSVEIANKIAYKLRESGKIKKVKGNILLDNNYQPIRKAGKFKALKAIGWFIEEFDFAQVSYNITDINLCPMHLVYSATRKEAKKRGVKVRGSELIGLIPLKAMLDAGDYFLKRKNKSTNIPELKKINYAIKKLGLDDLKPFKPEEKIIEYRMKNV